MHHYESATQINPKRQMYTEVSNIHRRVFSTMFTYANSLGIVSSSPLIFHLHMKGTHPPSSYAIPSNV